MNTINESKVIPSNYGSIPHLSTSKLSQKADKKIELGQELILTKKERKGDKIIVTEKIDGSNVGVVRKNGELIPITRAGYHCRTSKYYQHLLFAKYVLVNENIFEWLPEGFRICGEWCAQAHGTKYDLTNRSPFVAFDIIDNNNKRLSYTSFYDLTDKHNIETAPLIHIGSAITIEDSLNILESIGYFGQVEKPEGIVYRCENHHKVDFLAKWVRSDKIDGCYMKEEIFNIGFKL